MKVCAVCGVKLVKLPDNKEHCLHCEKVDSPKRINLLSEKDLPTKEIFCQMFRKIMGESYLSYIDKAEKTKEQGITKYKLGDYSLEISEEECSWDLWQVTPIIDDTAPDIYLGHVGRTWVHGQETLELTLLHKTDSIKEAAAIMKVERPDVAKRVNSNYANSLKIISIGTFQNR